MMRQIYEEEKGHVGSLLKQMEQQAPKVCGCGQWHCELCGFRRYHKRLQQIRKNQKITGYLTGGSGTLGKS